MFYQTAIILPISRIDALISLLDTIETQAKEKNMSDADILALSLTPDMLPFAKQIQIVSDNAKGMASRLTLQEPPKMEDNESTLAELRTRLQNTIDYLSTFSESDFLNSATAEVRFAYFPRIHLIGADYMLKYALPNFFFHVVTAYDILRHHGFNIGKTEFMGKNVPFIADAA